VLQTWSLCCFIVWPADAFINSQTRWLFEWWQYFIFPGCLYVYTVISMMSIFPRLSLCIYCDLYDFSRRQPVQINSCLNSFASALLVVQSDQETCMHLLMQISVASWYQSYETFFFANRTEHIRHLRQKTSCLKLTLMSKNTGVEK